MAVLAVLAALPAQALPAPDGSLPDPPNSQAAPNSPNAEEAGRLHSNRESEIKLSPKSRLPFFGPRYAPVTLDLFLPFGHRAVPNALKLLLRIWRENRDVRLVLHPVLGNDTAERGAAVLFAAWRQLDRQERLWALAEDLADHSDWLSLAAEPALLSAVRAHGFDEKRLLVDLKSPIERQRILDIWQSERNEIRLPPEVWFNGRRLRGTFSEAQLSEELLRQRSRAYQALRMGTPLSELYEEMLAKLRSEQAAAATWSSRTLLPPPPSSLGRLDLYGSPVRGPKIAPVTLLLIGSLDTYGTYLMARTVTEVFAARSDSLQVVFQHAPTSDNARRVAKLLGQLAYEEPDAFWRAFDGILELMKRRMVLRYADITELLSRQNVDVARLEAAVKDPARSDAVRTILERDFQQAQKLGLPYLPALFLDGRLVPNPLSKALLLRRIDSESARGLLSRFLHHP